MLCLLSFSPCWLPGPGADDVWDISCTCLYHRCICICIVYYIATSDLLAIISATHTTYIYHRVLCCFFFLFAGCAACMCAWCVVWRAHEREGGHAPMSNHTRAPSQLTQSQLPTRRGKHTGRRRDSRVARERGTAYPHSVTRNTLGGGGAGPPRHFALCRPPPLTPLPVTLLPLTPLLLIPQLLRPRRETLVWPRSRAPALRRVSLARLRAHCGTLHSARHGQVSSGHDFIYIYICVCVYIHIHTYIDTHTCIYIYNLLPPSGTFPTFTLRLLRTWSSCPRTRSTSRSAAPSRHSPSCSLCCRLSRAGCSRPPTQSSCSRPPHPFMTLSPSILRSTRTVRIDLYRYTDLYMYRYTYTYVEINRA